MAWVEMPATQQLLDTPGSFQKDPRSGPIFSSPGFSSFLQSNSSLPTSNSTPLAVAATQAGAGAKAQTGPLVGRDPLAYAELLRSRGKVAEALATYEAILAGNPRTVEAHVGKGKCFQAQRLARLAYDSYAIALNLDPKNAKALTQLGLLYKEEGHLLEAAEVNHRCHFRGQSQMSNLECIAGT